MQAVSGGDLAPARQWNHNSAYHRLIRRAVPANARDLLDVGCGDGALARFLAAPGRRVHGIDPDAGMIEQARALSQGVPELEFERGDYLLASIPDASHDFVCFLASLHHMDQTPALTKAARILRPGGVIVVVGLARAATVTEELLHVLRMPIVWFNDLRPDHATPPGMPVTDPVLGWRESREIAELVLPGVRYRSHLYYRYSLRWTKP